MALRQGNRIVALAAAQFQDDGPFRGEHLLQPVPFDGMVPQHERLGAVLHQHRFGGRLQQAAKRLIFSEFLQFTVSHVIFVWL